MDNQETEVVTPDLEKSFNETLEQFRVTYGGESLVKSELDEETEEDLEKAGKSKPKADMDYDDDADGEDEDEDDDEDDDSKSVKKSVEYMLSEDPEADAAMDVEPFLRSLAKAIDTRIDDLAKSVGDHFTGVETMLKSQGKAAYLQMELQKSQMDTVGKIANEAVETRGLMSLKKSRFESADGEPLEVQGQAILEKSRDWLKDQSISLLEAGMLENRVNKGVLGKSNDALEQKVAKLLKAEAK